MKQYDYLVLGAGPAGLAFSCRLSGYIKKLGKSILVLEKENEAGGLCRSVSVDGSPLDIGGGHFLDTRRPEVTRFLFHYMDREEWNCYERDTKIALREQMISYPIEANIWQLPVEEQVEYLKSIAVAGGNLGVPIPEKFTDWIYWKLGVKIAEEYMLPYNRKLYGNDLNRLGTYWMEKLPQVSFEETLLSCLRRKAYGKNPGHTRFYYPKRYGYGELWRRMAESIQDKIHYGAEVCALNMMSGEVRCKDGAVYYGKKIIMTLPWTSISLTGLPETIKEKVGHLKHTGVVINYCPQQLDTSAHWIYYPDERLDYHRILVRHNFCPASKGYWTETRTERFVENENYACMNEYAYPLNTVDKPETMQELLEYAETEKVFGLGRWGEHQHYNSDVVVERALALADRMWRENYE